MQENSTGQSHPWVLSETSIEWPLLRERMNAEYFNTVSVSSLTL